MAALSVALGYDFIPHVNPEEWRKRAEVANASVLSADQARLRAARKAEALENARQARAAEKQQKELSRAMAAAARKAEREAAVKARREKAAQQRAERARKKHEQLAERARQKQAGQEAALGETPAVAVGPSPCEKIKSVLRGLPDNLVAVSEIARLTGPPRYKVNASLPEVIAEENLACRQQGRPCFELMHGCTLKLKRNLVKIESHLRGHPGGLLTMMEMNELIGAGGFKVAKPKYRLGELVAKENALRQKDGRALIRYGHCEPLRQRQEGKIVAAIREFSGKFTGAGISLHELEKRTGLSRRNINRTHNFAALVAQVNLERQKAGLAPVGVLKEDERVKKIRKSKQAKTEGKIRQALVRHPGGRLTLDGLARSSGVSAVTLVKRGWRDFVAQENERRQAVEDQPLIQINGPKPAKITEEKKGGPGPAREVSEQGLVIPLADKLLTGSDGLCSRQELIEAGCRALKGAIARYGADKPDFNLTYLYILDHMRTFIERLAEEHKDKKEDEVATAEPDAGGQLAMPNAKGFTPEEREELERIGVFLLGAAAIGEDEKDAAGPQEEGEAELPDSPPDDGQEEPGQEDEVLGVDAVPGQEAAGETKGEKRQAPERKKLIAAVRKFLRDRFCLVSASEDVAKRIIQHRQINVSPERFAELAGIDQALARQLPKIVVEVGSIRQAGEPIRFYTWPKGFVRGAK